MLQLKQLCCIPWYIANKDGTKQIMNVSIGATKYIDIVVYAKRIWASIQSALRNKTAKLRACGSGRNASHRLNWSMAPEKAFALNIFMSSDVIVSKVKGYVRDMIGSVHVLAASDEFGYLDDCTEHINHQVRQSLKLMSSHNVEWFNANSVGENILPHDPRFARFTLQLPAHIDL